MCESPAETSVTGVFSEASTCNGVFSNPGLPRAPSSLQPHVKTIPLLERATVCIPPQTTFMIDLAGNPGPMSKIAGFYGFLISNGASSPRPIYKKRFN